MLAFATHRRQIQSAKGMPQRHRLSGIQRDVLSLYRQCLRQINKKPEESQIHFREYARIEFEKNLHLDKKDFSAIEFYLRKGHRQLETYAQPGIKNIH